MDRIDELVDTQLAAPHDQPWSPALDSCPVCKFGWHGLPKNGCPGGYTPPNS